MTITADTPHAFAPRARADSTVVLAWLGVVAQAVFIGGWLVAGLVQTGYSIAEDDISDLGALTADHNWIYNRTVSLSGLLTLALVVALHRRLPRTKRTVVALGALTVFAVGDLLDGFFRLDCYKTAACQQRVADHLISGRHIAHGIESGFTILALLVTPFLLAGVLAKAERWRSLVLPTRLFGALGVASVVAYFAAPDLGGISERVLAAGFSVWLAVLGVRAATVGADAGTMPSRP
jgi:hypothetical membrane protein